jgi:hypothetical protein
MHPRSVLRPGVAEARKKFETVQDVLGMAWACEPLSPWPTEAQLCCMVIARACADDTAGLLWELQRVQCKRRLTDTTGEPYTPDERAIGMHEWDTTRQGQLPAELRPQPSAPAANEIVFRLQMFLAKMPPAEAAGPAPAQASTTKAP